MACECGVVARRNLGNSAAFAVRLGFARGARLRTEPRRLPRCQAGTATPKVDAVQIRRFRYPDFRAPDFWRCEHNSGHGSSHDGCGLVRARHDGRPFAASGADQSGHGADHCGCGLVRTRARHEPCVRIDACPCAASGANRFARSTRSISGLILGRRCAHLRRWRCARAVIWRAPDASVAAARPAEGWRQHTAAIACSTSATRRSAAGRTTARR